MAKYGTAIWITLLAAISLFLAIPSTREVFENVTKMHPYIMGFVKFALLSTMGEFLALRLVTKEWRAVKGVFAKMFVWGILGIMIVAMFAIFTAGVNVAISKGLLWAGEPSFFSRLLTAFYISAIMNLTFAPVFMASHRISDTWIETRENIGVIISKTDWGTFIKFVVGKTIPFFWIPAHTITFMLPDQYRVLFAASLSIVLGLILSYAKLRK